MDWSTTGLKYRLLTITDNFHSWARFNRSDLLNEIDNIRIELSSQVLTAEHIGGIAEVIAELILQHGDENLHKEMDLFLKSTKMYTMWHDQKEKGTV
ncbi:MAG: hypothetical protein ACW98K_16880 [Candidatus Kariarchaeaceae archaeon]